MLGDREAKSDREGEMHWEELIYKVLLYGVSGGGHAIMSCYIEPMHSKTAEQREQT